MSCAYRDCNRDALQNEETCGNHEQQERLFNDGVADAKAGRPPCTRAGIYWEGYSETRILARRSKLAEAPINDAPLPVLGTQVPSREEALDEAFQRGHIYYCENTDACQCCQHTIDRLTVERDGFRDALHPLMRETAAERAKRHIFELEFTAGERERARAECRAARVEVARLTAENARMREALEAVMPALQVPDNGHHYCRGCHAGTGNGWTHATGCSYEVRRFAVLDVKDKVRAALGRDA